MSGDLIEVASEDEIGDVADTVALASDGAGSVLMLTQPPLLECASGVFVPLRQGGLGVGSCPVKRLGFGGLTRESSIPNTQCRTTSHSNVRSTVPFGLPPKTKSRTFSLTFALAH